MKFEIFRPKAEKMEPSDWMIVLFILHKALKAIIIGRMLKEKAPRSRSSQVQEYERQPLDLSILNQANEPSTEEKVPKVKAIAAKRGSSIFAGLPKLGNVFRRGALVPTSPAV